MTHRLNSTRIATIGPTIPAAIPVRTLATLATAAAALLAPIPGSTTPLHAQVIRGEVLDAGSMRPVPGAAVRLLDASGSELTYALVGTDGGFTMRAPAPAEYVLRVEMLGYATREVEVDLREGSVRREIALRPEAVSLGQVEVASGERSCALEPEMGARVYDLWTAARQTLERSAHTQGGGYRFRVTEYERRLDREGRRVDREDVATSSGYGPRPFYTPSAEVLEGEGYIVGNDVGHHEFYAPDAAVLLSDPFLANHCFRPPAETRPGQVGLAFEPASPRDIHDIRGTLWLDSATALLEEVEFRYTTLPWGAPVGDFGGRLSFRRLPDGSVIIDDWRLRIPRIETRTVGMPGRGIMRGGSKLLGSTEFAGEVTELWTPAGERIPTAGRATLTGTVRDSVNGGPLAGAHVVLENTAFSTRTDDAGRFTLEDLPPALYHVTFAHAVLDAMPRWRPAPVPVRLEPGDLRAVDLAVPSRATLLARACAPDQRPVVGRLTDAASGVPLAGADVALLGPDHAVLATRRADDVGVVRFCSGDPATAIRVRFLGRIDTTHALPPAGPVWESIAVPVSDPARVVGVVRDDSTGEPVTAARVVIAGDERVTDDRGRFIFPGLPPGEAEVIVEHLAYGTRTVAATLRGGQTNQLAIAIAQEAIALDPIEVTVAYRPLLEGGGLAGAERRMQWSRNSGLGVVLDAEELERQAFDRPSDALRRIPGVMVTAPGGETVVKMRNAPASLNGRECFPVLYVDGIKQSSESGADGSGVSVGVSIDEVVVFNQIAALEVYRRASEIPIEFAGSDARCGVIAIWTKRGGG